jgi:hypothetical protein
MRKSNTCPRAKKLLWEHCVLFEQKHHNIWYKWFPEKLPLFLQYVLNVPISIILSQFYYPTRLQHYYENVQPVVLGSLLTAHMHQTGRCITRAVLRCVLCCNGFDQRFARQQLCKHGPIRNNRGSCCFCVRGDVKTVDSDHVICVFCSSDRRANRLGG